MTLNWGEGFPKRGGYGVDKWWILPRLIGVSTPNISSSSPQKEGISASLSQYMSQSDTRLITLDRAIILAGIGEKSMN